MVDIYDDHEQSERVRQWIKENGAAVVMGVVLAIGGLYGWKFWQKNQDQTRMGAAAEFLGLTNSLDGRQFEQANSHFETIQSEYPKSSYRVMGQLMIAAARVRQGQPDLAVKLYRDLIESVDANSRFFEIIAAERLARVLLDQGQLDEAGKLVNKYSNEKAFAPRFEEVRGDLLAARGNLEGARQAYQQALDAMQAGTGDRQMLELKRDGLAGLTGKSEES